MDGCFSYMYIIIPQIYSTYEGQKRVGSSGTRVTEGCEPPCACCECNPGPLEEQQVLLTIDPSLQPKK